MPDWSIKIVAAPHPTYETPAAFQPDLQGAKPGDPLQAMVADLVSWNNTTHEAHWPWPTDSSFNPLSDSQVPRGSPNYLSDEIAPGQSSRPTYSPRTGGTIYYCCKLHQGEHGAIDVSPIPPLQTSGPST